MNNQITSLKHLINQLRNTSNTKYKSIGASLDLPLEELKPYMFWSEEHYTRNCIIREMDFELILLCWEQGQDTPIHCHGGEECWVYIMGGQIEETHYQFKNDKLIKEEISMLQKGEKSFMTDDIGYHRLNNNTPHRVISLHLYMDPIDECTVYDHELNEFVPVSLNYYSYQGVLEDVKV